MSVYSREIVAIQPVAEPVNPQLANYLRKKLRDKNRADSHVLRILDRMNDSEVIDSFHRYEEERTAKVTRNK